MLPSGPSNITTPVPSTAVPSRKKIKSLPLIQLGWEEGESLVLRASNKDEHERLMRILGEAEADDAEKDEKEREDRKDRELSLSTAYPQDFSVLTVSRS